MKELLGYIKRIWIFLIERYPPYIGLTQSIVGTLSLFYAAKIALVSTERLFSLSFIYACLTLFVYLLVMRIADEFKDREVDKVLFKERCLPAGKVKYSDIGSLGIISVVVLFAIHFVSGSNHILFSAAMIFVFLFYKYFFLPKVISNNLLLALVTHCPITLILNAYLLTFFTPGGSFTPWEKHFSIAAGMWMSAVAWETSRKIRVNEDENDYTTYSKVLGTRAATLLPLLALGSQIFFFGVPLTLVSAFSIAFLPFGLFFLAFMLHPTRKMSTFLRPATEAFVVIGMLIIIVSGVLGRAA